MVPQRTVFLVVALLGAATCIPAAAQTTTKGKKVIEWGWDEPDTKFIRENIKRMEQFPFDGLVFHAMSGKGENLSWEVWGNRKFANEDFRQAIDDLKVTEFKRFTDCFLAATQ